MQSAERLFAQRGYDGVSVRDIAGDAGVNSALVGYYFGNKEGLLAEVYTRRCEALREERARLLAEYSTGGREPRLEEVLDAFLTPSLARSQDDGGNRTFPHLRIILAAESSPLLDKLMAQTYDESSQLFVKALARCLPHLSREDLLWRFHFLLATLDSTAAGPHRVKALSRGRLDPSDPAATKSELIPFLVAGFRAPAIKPRPRGGARLNAVVSESRVSA